MSDKINEPDAKALLSALNAKMDEANHKLDRLEVVAAKNGAIAGGVTGGLVATAILVIKAKLGL